MTKKLKKGDSVLIISAGRLCGACQLIGKVVSLNEDRNPLRSYIVSCDVWCERFKCQRTECYFGKEEVIERPSELAKELYG
jgi:hypothetical protein